MPERFRDFAPAVPTIGLALLGLIYHENTSVTKHSSQLVFLDTLTADGPGALIMCSIGFMCAKLVDARRPLVMLGLGSVALGGLLHVAWQGIGTSTCNILAPLGLVTAMLAILAIRSNAEIIAMLSILTSVAALLFTLGIPLTVFSEYPLLANFCYGLLGMSMERATHHARSRLIFIFCFSVIVAISGLFTVWPTIYEPSSTTYLGAPQRFISPSPHSGGLLNLFGNYGFLCYALVISYFVSNHAKARALFTPLYDLGSVALTVYLLNCALLMAFPARLHDAQVVGIECATIVAVACAYRRFYRVGPIEHVLLRIVGIEKGR
ncbi:hypothetical protein QVA66_05170 [Staphylococcus chromogenes]|nr:hypothetical protein [Staphylococcus chromogenes]